MTDDGGALLAAIRAEPGEDTPRLAYADWLDEHGQSERAEFIRVQVEIERAGARSSAGCSMLPDNTCSGSNRAWAGLSPGHEPVWCPKCLPAVRLLERERELWGRFEDSPMREAFRRESPLLRAWNVVPGYMLDGPGFGSAGTPLAVVRRGFVAEVRTTLADLFGGPCGQCGVTGSIPFAAGQSCPRCGGRAFWRSGVHFDHQKLCVSDRCGEAFVPGQEYRRRCHVCSGTGRVPGVAADLFARHPVTTVAVPWLEPDHSRRDDDPVPWFWAVGEPSDPALDGYPDSARVPAAVALAGPRLPRDDVLTAGRFRPALFCFATESRARDWLSAACVALGRTLAGMTVPA